MLKWMKHNCDLTGEHATIHVFDSDPTSVGWAGFNFDGKEEVSLKPFLKRLWVIVPFFCFLTLKDFCRFLTDFSQLYLLHWAFRNCRHRSTISFTSSSKFEPTHQPHKMNKRKRTTTTTTNNSAKEFPSFSSDRDTVRQRKRNKMMGRTTASKPNAVNMGTTVVGRAVSEEWGEGVGVKG